MLELDELSQRFWAWRARQQPRTRDDIPRLDRPARWRPEVEAALAVQRRDELGAFESELARIRPDQDAVPDRVDHRLLRSALARVRWENDVLRVRGIPRFWTDQALGPVFDALLRPGVDAARVAEVTRLLRAVPGILAHAPAALSRPAREFAALAVAELDGIAARVEACAQALARIDAVPGSAAAELGSAAAEAGGALEQFGGWLAGGWPSSRPRSRSAASGTSGSCARWPASRWAWTRSASSGAASTTGRSGSSCCTPPATGTCRCRRCPPTPPRRPGPRPATRRRSGRSTPSGAC